MKNNENNQYSGGSYQYDPNNNPCDSGEYQYGGGYYGYTDNYQQGGGKRRGIPEKAKWILIAGIAVVVVVLVVLLIGGSGDETGSTYISDVNHAPGQSSVETFLKDFFSGKKRITYSCVPSQVRQNVEASLDNSEYVGVRVAKVAVQRHKQLDDEDIEELRDDFLRGTGAYLDIQEAYEYEFAVIIQYPDGKLSTGRGDEILSVKIQGQWYALPNIFYDYRDEM